MPKIFSVLIPRTNGFEENNGYFCDGTFGRVVTVVINKASTRTATIVEVPNQIKVIEGETWEGFGMRPASSVRYLLTFKAGGAFSIFETGIMDGISSIDLVKRNTNRHVKTTYTELKNLATTKPINTANPAITAIRIADLMFLVGKNPSKNRITNVKASEMYRAEEMGITR